MKRTVLIGLTLALAACGASTPPASQVPAQTQNLQLGGSSPAYNPDANPVEQNDPRLPYHGDWTWLVGLANGAVYAGDASIGTSIIDPNKQLVNNGFGTYRWCADLGCTGAPRETNVGSVATYPDGGGALAVAMDVNETGDFRWVFIDTDGKVGNLAGLPLLDGTGYFNLPDGTRQSGYFVMVQTSTDPQTTELPAVTAQVMRELLNRNTVTIQRQAATANLDRIQQLYKQFKAR